MEHNYFLNQEYKSREQNETLDVNRQESYWDPKRIHLSNYYQYPAYTFARRLIKQHQLTSVIDLGCGTAKKLMDVIYPFCKTITGVDQPEIIEYCKSLYSDYSRAIFRVADLEQPVLPPITYDLIMMVDVIEHLIDPDQLLKACRQLAHPKSFILISTPERDVLRGSHCMTSEKLEHVREWNQRELACYLEASGFKILTHAQTSFVKLTFNKTILMNIYQTFRKCQTLKTNQLVLCQLNQDF